MQLDFKKNLFTRLFICLTCLQFIFIYWDVFVLFEWIELILFVCLFTGYVSD